MTNKHLKMNSGANTKFDKKLLVIPVIVIVVVAVVVSWQIYGHPSKATKSKVALPALKLTLVGANGTQKILNADELAALQSYTAAGGYVSETGKKAYGNYTGVPILTLLNLVGGITSTENVTVTGSDGYQVTFTYQQLQGQGFNTYDPNTLAAVQPAEPLTMIVAYYCNGTVLSSGQGPLSIAIVGQQGFDTPGAYWVYLLVKIQVV